MSRELRARARMISTFCCSAMLSADTRSPWHRAQALSFHSAPRSVAPFRDVDHCQALVLHAKEDVLENRALRHQRDFLLDRGDAIGERVARRGDRRRAAPPPGSARPRPGGLPPAMILPSVDFPAPPLGGGASPRQFG